MSKTPAATYRVIGVRFDGSREVTSQGDSHEKAEEKRLMLLFTHAFPSAVIESEDHVSTPGNVDGRK
jgi:hypothetical protein